VTRLQSCREEIRTRLTE